MKFTQRKREQMFLTENNYSGYRLELSRQTLKLTKSEVENLET